jgi:transposase-like protein
VTQKVLIRYSEAFKHQVLRELEEGKFNSIQAAGRAYGIRGGTTIQSWILRYGRAHLMRKVVRVETPKEINETKELRKRVRDLEKALADAHLGQRFDEAYLRIACRAAGIEDVEDFKKKHAGER